ncbi:MAG: HTTM domain-containing protein [Polyangiales bacterium]
MNASPNIRALGWCRVAIGAIFLVHGPLYGWPRGDLRAAVFGLLLPPLVVKALVIVRTLGALCFMLGYRARHAGIVASLAAYLVYAQEPFALIYTLHVLYLSTFLLACTDATSIVALDPTPMRAPESSVSLIRAFVLSIYGWSAFAKLRTDWTSGSTLSLLYHEGYLTGPLARAFVPNHARALGIGTIAMEIALPILLMIPRTRASGILLACLFHAALEITFHPGVFSWVMVALLAAFLPRHASSRR